MDGHQRGDGHREGAWVEVSKGGETGAICNSVKNFTKLYLKNSITLLHLKKRKRKSVVC